MLAYVFALDDCLCVSSIANSLLKLLIIDPILPYPYVFSLFIAIHNTLYYRYQEYHSMLSTQEEVRQRLASYRVEVAKERGSSVVVSEDNSRSVGDDKGVGDVVGGIGSESVDESLVVDDEDDEEDDDDDDDDASTGDDDALSSSMKSMKGEGDGDSDDDDGDLESEDGQVVSEEEYMSYVRDADIECYLRGLLWVVQMYMEGVCPDFSYSFAGK